jgi:hypothetical protein
MDNHKVWLPIALLVPTLIVVIGVQSTFWFDLRASLSNVETIYISFSLIGLYFFSKIKFDSKLKLVIAWAVYLFVLANIIFWASLFTACANGDCL